MKPIRNFTQLTEHLKSLNRRKRIAVVCANDPNTEYAIARALEEGIAEFLMLGHPAILHKYPTLRRYPEYVKIVPIDNPDEAAREAVRMAREGEADILMKGIINDIEIYRCRDLIDKTPIYKAYLTKANEIKNRYSRLLLCGTYNDVLGFSLSNGDVEARAFIAGDEMAIVATNPSEERLSTEISVPGYEYVECAALGTPETSGDGKSVTLGQYDLVVLIYSKAK